MANSEDPYKVMEQVMSGSYYLETIEGARIPRTWHSSNLRKYSQ